MPLATYLAVEKARTAEHLDLDDLLSAARMGLAQAAVSFDPSRGVPFGAYASSQIKWAILNEMRGMDPAGERSREKIKLLRVASDLVVARHDRAATVAELANESGLSLEVVTEMMKLDEMVRTSTSYEEHFASENGRHEYDLTETVILPDQTAEQTEEREMLVRMVDALPEPMRTIIRGIYLEDRSVKSLAEEMSVSHPYVSKVRTKALALMREAMNHWNDGAPVHTTSKAGAEFFQTLFGESKVTAATVDEHLLAVL